MYLAYHPAHDAPTTASLRWMFAGSLRPSEESVGQIPECLLAALAQSDNALRRVLVGDAEHGARMPNVTPYERLLSAVRTVLQTAMDSGCADSSIRNRAMDFGGLRYACTGLTRRIPSARRELICIGEMPCSPEQTLPELYRTLKLCSLDAQGWFAFLTVPSLVLSCLCMGRALSARS